MATLLFSSALLSYFVFVFVFVFATTTDAGNVGVNWGRVANNLPSPPNVVSLLKSDGITSVKLYDADPAVLTALANTGITVTVTIPNEQLFYAATRPSFAYHWVLKNVASYYPRVHITSVAVGNEVFVDPHNLTKTLVPAMTNVHEALARLKLDGIVKVSSPIALSALANSYPSSAGVFREDLVDNVMKPMLDLLRRTGSYLMLNVYPFFAYAANSDVISLEYALFRPNAGVVDPNTGKRYFSLFDAQLDAVFSAMKAVGFEDVKVVVSETGWPSKGDENEIGAGEENAAAYNGNLLRRVLSGNAGTPLMPDTEIDVYLFALFNEDQKTGPTSERNYGLFYPTQQKVYDLDFHISSSGSSTKNNNHSRVEETTRRSVSTPGTAPAAVGMGGSPSSSGGGGGGGRWCVANGAVGEERLQAALDYACGEGGADCDKIQPGKECFSPNTLVSHASFAFNSYYQKNSRAVGTCDFDGAAYVVTQTQPPKYGPCEFTTGY